VKKRILVVDDERDLVDLITYNLKREGYDVLSAPNGQEALSVLEAGPADLVILDLMMPVLDGFETCKRMKSTPATAGIPVMFLTARSGEVDEILGLELGADDYIQKPISPRKLVARVKALFRRLEKSGEDASAQTSVRRGRLEINRQTYTVRVGTTEVFFPRKEFELLFTLASHPGRVYTREMLLNTIWGADVYVLDRTVDVHIRKIREKLGEDGVSIETIKGVGYRFRE
jgi:two-component system alkaline phosphatase synthesis response regulator PhoP